MAWVPRADGHGREIAGISQELMDAFSSRRQTITADARAVAAEREAQTGRRPDARQMYRIQKDIAYRTRAAKPEAPLDIRAKLREWEQTAREQDLGELSAIPDAVAEAARMAREREQQQAGAGCGGAGGAAGGAGDRVGVRPSARPGAGRGRSSGAIERFARFITLNGADTRPVDPALLLRGWQAQERADAEAQQQIRREIARAQARSGAPPGPASGRGRWRTRRPPRGLSEDQARYVMAEAIAVTQARIPAWTRADLIRYLGEALPAGALADRGRPGDPGRPRDQRRGRGAGGAAVRAGMAARPRRAAPGGRRVGVPAARRRTVRQPGAAHPGGAAPGAGAGTRRAAPGRRDGGAAARRGPGAAPGAASARARPPRRRPGPTGSGLRMDQAAAAWYVLTSPRRAEVMVGPAGTGKTRTAIEMARAWQQAGMGPVVALTASSNARNVMREEAARHGVAELACYNTAEWLGHAEGAREAREPVALAPGTPDHPR